MKKLSFYAFTMLLTFTTTFGFVSCGDDDEDEEYDFRDEFIGTYSNSIKAFLLDDEGYLIPLYEEPTTPAEVEKSGKRALNIDGIKTSDLTEAYNGFTFDIPSQYIDGVIYKGWSGYECAGEKYHGGYMQETGLLSFYMAANLEEFAEDLNDKDTENLAKLLIALKLGSGATLDDLESIDTDKYAIVIEYKLN